MPRGWTRKDKRKVGPVASSTRSRGSGMRRARQIATRTMNQARRLQGRTRQPRSSAGLPLAERTRAELYAMARKMRIPGRSAMNKSQLVRALRRLS